MSRGQMCKSAQDTALPGYHYKYAQNMTNTVRRQTFSKQTHYKINTDDIVQS